MKQSETKEEEHKVTIELNKVVGKENYQHQQWKLTKVKEPKT